MKVSGVRYAVIDGPHTKAGHERIVIAYPTERALRDLIAAPSIIAFGFSSREEALVDACACLPAATTFQRLLRAFLSLMFAGCRSQVLTEEVLSGKTCKA